MKQIRQVGMIAFITLSVLTSCSFMNSSNMDSSFDRDELEEFEVKNKEDEVREGDFIFRLVSEKEVYEVGEEIELYGEMTYVGDQEEVVIGHASHLFIFPMVEHVREHDISGGTTEEAIATTLTKNKPYREAYDKNGVGYAEKDPQAYKSFIQGFMNRDDFPPGYYEVQGEADFDVGNERLEMRATVDFKVVE